MSEQWRAIPGFEGSYEVSDRGRVRSLDRVICRRLISGREHPKRVSGRLLKLWANRNDRYLRAALWCENAPLVTTVHALVAAAFLGPRPAGADVCHLNGDERDNRPDNLRYDTRSGNHADKRLHGTQPTGERSHLAKLTRKQVEQIRLSAEPASKLAATLPVQGRHVRRIRSGEFWPDV